MFGGITVDSSLARLLQPVGVDTFLDEIWATRHHHMGLTTLTGASLDDSPNLPLLPSSWSPDAEEGTTGG
ncbi:hypothetical protein A5753_18600 [Mycobacterium sp. 852002-51971_SCH5477799-a]|uniref:PPW family C-terminal domain-containing PPE protein n=1 Tax=Mycobacterium sp. 852002-51971_SCH5477799-a TaxID=1834106 RepID=UPI0007FDA5A5|nr:hypothetical protein [Mycobacterium sp. 852002-51971_SCH5477799-a]OBF61247.1 hypothetical protein A5753_18600 [Mycobacterium sp. 852002-51971_SCH5477799-a]